MRTVQMTLDDDQVEAVDRAVKELKTTRSAFTRVALRDALKKLKIRQLEEKHRKGYALHPVKGDEFHAWETEQDWGEE
jgi:metal-responsive CopG/Arc/MetJ family transcriptional regulator